MSVTLKTRVMVWGRAAATCSMPNCGLHLVFDENEGDDASLVGEVCHIVAESENGPRGVSTLSLSQRNKYSNLLLLCNVHHKLIDDQPETFSVAVLQGMKATHEASIRHAWGKQDEAHVRAREQVAGYIDHLNTTCEFDEWNAWTSWLLSDYAGMTKARLENFEKLPNWILSRVWPKEGFAKTEWAFTNFRRVLQALLNTFKQHLERNREESDSRHVKKFYQDADGTAAYHKLLARWEAHISLLHDYVLELTRAGNLLCDAIREEVVPNFGISSGYLLITFGPDASLRTHTRKPLYQEDEVEKMFEGERAFNKLRLSRDMAFGTENEVSLIEEQMRLRAEMLSGF